MKTENNKGRRQELTQLKYKIRLKRFANSSGYYFVFRNGDKVYSPTWDALARDHAQLQLKSQGVLCSCWMCSGYYKYNRNDFRQETSRLLKDWMEENE